MGEGNGEIFKNRWVKLRKGGSSRISNYKQYRHIVHTQKSWAGREEFRIIASLYQIQIRIFQEGSNSGMSNVRCKEQIGQGYGRGVDLLEEEGMWAILREEQQRNRVGVIEHTRESVGVQCGGGGTRLGRMEESMVVCRGGGERSNEMEEDRYDRIESTIDREGEESKRSRDKRILTKIDTHSIAAVRQQIGETKDRGKQAIREGYIARRDSGELEKVDENVKQSERKRVEICSKEIERGRGKDTVESESETESIVLVDSHMLHSCMEEWGVRGQKLGRKQGCMVEHSRVTKVGDLDIEEGVERISEAGETRNNKETVDKLEAHREEGKEIGKQGRRHRGRKGVGSDTQNESVDWVDRKKLYSCAAVISTQKKEIERQKGSRSVNGRVAQESKTVVAGDSEELESVDENVAQSERKRIEIYSKEIERGRGRETAKNESETDSVDLVDSHMLHSCMEEIRLHGQEICREHERMVEHSRMTKAGVLRIQEGVERGERSSEEEEERYDIIESNIDREGEERKRSRDKRILTKIDTHSNALVRQQMGETKDRGNQVIREGYIARRDSGKRDRVDENVTQSKRKRIEIHSKEIERGRGREPVESESESDSIDLVDSYMLHSCMEEFGVQGQEIYSKQGCMVEHSRVTKVGDLDIEEGVERIREAGETRNNKETADKLEAHREEGKEIGKQGRGHRGRKRVVSDTQNESVDWVDRKKLYSCTAVISTQKKETEGQKGGRSANGRVAQESKTAEVGDSEELERVDENVAQSERKKIEIYSKEIERGRGRETAENESETDSVDLVDSHMLHSCMEEIRLHGQEICREHERTKVGGLGIEEGGERNSKAGGTRSDIDNKETVDKSEAHREEGKEIEIQGRRYRGRKRVVRDTQNEWVDRNKLYKPIYNGSSRENYIYQGEREEEGSQSDKDSIELVERRMSDKCMQLSKEKEARERKGGEEIGNETILLGDKYRGGLDKSMYNGSSVVDYTYRGEREEEGSLSDKDSIDLVDRKMLDKCMQLSKEKAARERKVGKEIGNITMEVGARTGAVELEKSIYNGSGITDYTYQGEGGEEGSQSDKDSIELVDRRMLDKCMQLSRERAARERKGGEEIGNGIAEVGARMRAISIRNLEEEGQLSRENGVSMIQRETLDQRGNKRTARNYDKQIHSSKLGELRDGEETGHIESNSEKSVRTTSSIAELFRDERLEREGKKIGSKDVTRRKVWERWKGVVRGSIRREIRRKKKIDKLEERGGQDTELVFDYTTQGLAIDEVKLLGKGEAFCIADYKIDEDRSKVDIYQYQRRLRLHEVFRDPGIREGEEIEEIQTPIGRVGNRTRQLDGERRNSIIRGVERTPITQGRGGRDSTVSIRIRGDGATRGSRVQSIVRRESRTLRRTLASTANRSRWENGVVTQSREGRRSVTTQGRGGRHSGVGSGGRGGRGSEVNIVEVDTQNRE